MELKNISALVIAILAIGLCHAIRKGGRIIGGVLDKIENVPYLVHLRYEGKFRCGGSLIALDKVLTAAHCVVGRDNKDITIFGGSSFLDHGAIQRNVINKISSPDFSRVTNQGDYAVLRLDRPFDSNDVKTIGLCTEPARPGTIGSYFGWGKTATNKRISNQVRVVRLPLYSKDECVRNFADIPHQFDRKTMSCGSEPYIRELCRGDSGGPFVINNEIHGVGSFSGPCDGYVGKPAVYNDVCALRKTIEKFAAEV